MASSIQLNKVVKHILTNVSFDMIPENTLLDIFKDGRVFSHFIERWTPQHYPLEWVAGCKKYDFKDVNDSNIICAITKEKKNEEEEEEEEKKTYNFAQAKSL